MEFENVLRITQNEVAKELQQYDDLGTFFNNWFFNLPTESSESSNFKDANEVHSIDMLHQELFPTDGHSQLFAEITPRAFIEIRNKAINDLGLDDMRIRDLTQQRIDVEFNAKEVDEQLAYETMPLFIYMRALGFNDRDLKG